MIKLGQTTIAARNAFVFYREARNQVFMEVPFELVYFTK